MTRPTILIALAFAALTACTARASAGNGHDLLTLVKDVPLRSVARLRDLEVAA